MRSTWRLAGALTPARDLAGRACAGAAGASRWGLACGLLAAAWQPCGAVFATAFLRLCAVLGSALGLAACLRGAFFDLASWRAFLRAFLAAFCVFFAACFVALASLSGRLSCAPSPSSLSVESWCAMVIGASSWRCRVWRNQAECVTARIASASQPNTENQRLSFEMELLDVARGAVELVPHLGETRKAGQAALGSRRAARAEPVAHARRRRPGTPPGRCRASASPSACRARGSTGGSAASSVVVRSRTSARRRRADQRARDAAVGGVRGLDVGACRRDRCRARRPPRATSSAASGRSAAGGSASGWSAAGAPGAWLTSSSSERGGGSSRIFSSALAPAALSSSAESTMQTRQPPSPAVEPKKPMVWRDIVDRDDGAQLALVVRRALQREQVAGPCAATRRAAGWSAASASDARVLHGRRGRIGMREHEARHAVGERRLADAARRRRSARHAACARRDRHRGTPARPRDGRRARRSRADAGGRRPRSPFACSRAGRLDHRAPRAPDEAAR